MKLFEYIKKPQNLGAAILIVFVMILIFATVTETLSIIRLKYEIASINDSLDDYKNSNKMLTEKIDQMGTDHVIEETAREKLGMVKTGETPIKVIEGCSTAKDTTTLDAQEKFEIYMKDWYTEMGKTLRSLQLKNGGK